MKAPAFQFYPADFMMGTLAMSAEEVGGYIRLLCYQWEHGPIPDDQALLARITGCGGNAVASIRHKFGICQNGALANERLEKVRAAQLAYRQKQAQNAANRWKHKNGDAVAMPAHMPAHMPKPCSPSLSSKDKEPALPEVLNCEDFRQAWSDYMAHRRELRLRKLKPKSIEQQWRIMAEWGLTAAVEAIRTTIRNGWHGVFAPKALAAAATNQPPRPVRTGWRTTYQ